MDGDRSGTGPTRATRLTIVHQGDDLKVLSSQSVRMVVPPTDQTYSTGRHAGFWFEVHGKDKECLYRRVIPNPFRGDIEAPSGDPERPFTRVPSTDKEKVFVLLVPELEAGQELVLFASPKGVPGARARPVAALDLRKPTGKMRILARSEDLPEAPDTPKTKRPRPTSTKGKK